MAYNSGSDPTLAELITSKFVPEMFSSETIMHTKSNLVTVGAFNTNWRNQLRKGYKVSIPVFSEVSATEVTPGTEPTAQDAAGTAASITVDQWYEATVEISDLMEIEEEADYLKGAAESAGYAISKKIDTTVGALFSTLSSSSVHGADGQTFTDVIFRALVEGLDEADVPDDMRVIIGDPSTKSDMFDIDKFVRNDYTRGGVIATGQLGTLYNSKVLITNNLTAASSGNYGVYAHRDAIGIVLQRLPRSKAWDLGYKFITKIIVDSAFGAAEIRDVFGKAFYTRKS